MAAKVKPADGRWIAVCEECPESNYGTMAQVDLWADVHNSINHPEKAN